MVIPNVCNMHGIKNAVICIITIKANGEIFISAVRNNIIHEDVINMIFIRA
jgi:hypothetical protein